MATSYMQPTLFEPAQAAPTWPFGRLKPYAYQMIMADPPWHFETRSEAGEGKSPQAHYDTMSLDEIVELPVGDLASDNCLLWLWATAPMLRQAFDVLDGWGFEFVTSGVWVKQTARGKLGFGTGYVLRNAHEPFLLGRIGAPKTTRSVRSVVQGPLREHSRKPDQAFRAAEALMPEARRCELFSRTDRPAWETWGNEAGTWQAQGASNGR